MTVEKLIRILRENDIPEDAILMSDSGWSGNDLWECWASDIDGLYYHAKDNAVVFTQDYASRRYNKNSDWIKLGLKEEWIFTRIYFDRNENTKYTVECPSCHEKWITCNDIGWRKGHEFCPNCGVRKVNL